ncbi:MAG: hypothetical protein WC476_01400 [Phycisphaerae bacterium]|jgi:hypothetical protein
MNIYSLMRKHRTAQEVLVKASIKFKFKVIDEVIGNKIPSKANFILVDKDIDSNIIAFIQLDYIEDHADILLFAPHFSEAIESIGVELKGYDFRFGEKYPKAEVEFL